MPTSITKISLLFPANFLPLEYIVVVEVNVSQVILIQQIESSLNSMSLPLQLDNTTEISSLNITTVCQPNGTNHQCVCEDQYVWSYNDCVEYAACDDITAGTCGCISAIPSDGQMCVPKSELSFIDYLVEIEMNTTSITVIDDVRSLLLGLNLPIPFSNATEITAMDLTTVCVLNTTGYQCWCEDQYFWPCDKCAGYGHCDNITNATCGCINAIPNDGQFCQPMTELITIPALTEYLIEIEIDTMDAAVIAELRDRLKTLSSPLLNSSVAQISEVNITTAPPPTEYVAEIEIDTVDAAVLNQLRTLLKNLSLPLGISDVQITELNITTDTTPCPVPTTPAPPPTEYVVEVEIDTVDAAVLNQLRTLLKNLSFPLGISDVQITELNITTAPPSTEYVAEVEIDTVDAAVLNQLRTLLKNLSFPLGISDVQITELNITTVCLLNNTGYQCLCEDQYFWPCNKCTKYGSCDNINNVTCGCIGAVPDDGQFCQPMTELTNTTPCPVPTTPAPPPTEYVAEVEIDTVDAAVLNQLRTLLKNLSFPLGISDVQITELNITTDTTPCPVPTTPAPPPTEYVAEVEIDTVDAAVLNQLRTLLKNLSFPLGISDVQITELNITTDTTPCPVPTTPAPPPTEYVVEVEIDTVDAAVLNQLRTLLKNLSFPLGISDVQITELNITTDITVCPTPGK
ncbi:hypothetical protein AOLI_G00029330 [Acnodon oligacanthus]